MDNWFERSVLSSEFLKIGKNQLPWLKDDKKVPLAEVKCHNGKTFYFGSLICEKRLLEAARSLNEHESKQADHLIASGLPPFIDNGSCPSKIDRLKFPRTDFPIYYLANPAGARVYFVRTQTEKQKPVILIVAKCNKSEEKKVYGVITSLDPNKWNNR